MFTKNPSEHVTNRVVHPAGQVVHAAGQLVHAAGRVEPHIAAVPTPICKSIAQHNYLQAYETLRATPRSPLILHTLGVCAIRAGLVPQAVSIFRDLCLLPGTPFIRLETDDTLRLNYATAILLTGMPSGALDILRDLKEIDAPEAMAIKAAINRWAQGLSFWRRLDWKISRIDPPHAVVPLDFAAGIFPFAIPTSETSSTGSLSSASLSNHLTATGSSQ